MAPGDHREHRRLQQISLGLVGAESDWETRFRPIIGNFKHGRVVAVYAPVPGEAEMLGRETGGAVFYSLRRMIAAGQVQGLLVLESGAISRWAVAMAIEAKLPVYVSAPIDQSQFPCVDQWVAWEEEGAVLVPGAVARATPTALRLRELVATKLGSVREVHITLQQQSPGGRQVIQAIDWCRSLLGSNVSSMERHRTASEDRLVLQCGRTSSPSVQTRTEIDLSGRIGSTDRPSGPDTTAATTTIAFQARVTCAMGEAQLFNERVIHWSTHEERVEEHLESDRSADEVLIDLFLRRAVGGVVPVPSWSDIREARHLWEKAQ